MERGPSLDQLTTILTAGNGTRPDEEARLILEAAPSPEAALDMAQQRAGGAPLAQVLGRQTFLGVPLQVRHGVLAPREETELLALQVLAVLTPLADREPPPRLLDMGCGSGNLACAAATALPRLQVWASDLTPACAALTRENAQALGLGDRIRVTEGDLFAPLAGQGLEGTLDAVAMNPPYIPTATLERSHGDLLRHEPREAFDGGPYGISLLSRLLKEGQTFVRTNGHLLFEFGKGQAPLIQRLSQQVPGWGSLEFAHDAQGEPRVARLTRLG